MVRGKEKRVKKKGRQGMEYVVKIMMMKAMMMTVTKRRTILTVKTKMLIMVK